MAFSCDLIEIILSVDKEEKVVDAEYAILSNLKVKKIIRN